jgi:hypothetical protein
MVDAENASLEVSADAPCIGGLDGELSNLSGPDRYPVPSTIIVDPPN